MIVFSLLFFYLHEFVLDPNDSVYLRHYNVSECIIFLGILCKWIFYIVSYIFMDKYTLYFIELLLYIACIFFLYNTMLMSLNAHASLAYKIISQFLKSYSNANLHFGWFGGWGGIHWHGWAQYGLDNYVFPSKQSGNRFHIRTGGCNFFY